MAKFAGTGRRRGRSPLGPHSGEPGPLAHRPDVRLRPGSLAPGTASTRRLRFDGGRSLFRLTNDGPGHQPSLVLFLQPEIRIESLFHIRQMPGTIEDGNPLLAVLDLLAEDFQRLLVTFSDQCRALGPLRDDI